MVLMVEMEQTGLIGCALTNGGQLRRHYLRSTPWTTPLGIGINGGTGDQTLDADRNKDLSR